MKVPYVDFSAQFNELKTETLEAIQSVFQKGDFILGDAVSEFENRFAHLIGVKHAIGVANGTDAIVLALKILGVGSGDEVITVPNSWISTAAAIAFAGATPRFVDVEFNQLIDLNLLEKSITPQTKAIIPVHLTGRCCNLPALRRFCDDRKLFLIEDCAQSVTSSFDGFSAGTVGEVNCFSLHPLKNLNAAGDAGMITTNSDEYAARARTLRNHGLIDRDNASEWGFNSRLDTIQAAVLLTRIGKLNDWVHARRKNAAKYRHGLKDLAPRVQMPEDAHSEWNTYHLFVIQCDHRNLLREHLTKQGISTKIHYPIPIHLQPPGIKLGYSKGSFPVTEQQAERILSLPIHQYLKNEQIDYIIDEIKIFFTKHAG